MSLIPFAAYIQRAHAHTRARAHDRARALMTARARAHADRMQPPALTSPLKGDADADDERVETIIDNYDDNSTMMTIIDNYDDNHDEIGR